MLLVIKLTSPDPNSVVYMHINVYEWKYAWRCCYV